MHTTKETVLITGAAGFIGYSLAKRLLKDDKYNILLVDNLNDYYEISLKMDRLKQLSNGMFFHVDISDKASLEGIFSTHTVDIVVNLAAQAGVTYAKEHPDGYIVSNIDGFFNVIDLAAKYKVKKLLYASSSSVYGNTNDMPFVESANCSSPMSLYAATKLADEAIATAYYYTHNVLSVGMRFFNVYGPWGRPDMAYFKWTKALLGGTEIELRNKGEMWRDMTYVDDVVESIIRLFDIELDRSEVVNIGNRSPVKIANLLDHIATKLEIRPNIKFTQKGDEEPVKTWSSTAKLEGLIGYSPETSYQTGIDEFVGWYRKYYGEN